MKAPKVMRLAPSKGLSDFLIAVLEENPIHTQNEADEPAWLFVAQKVGILEDFRNFQWLRKAGTSGHSTAKSGLFSLATEIMELAIDGLEIWGKIGRGVIEIITDIFPFSLRPLIPTDLM